MGSSAPEWDLRSIGGDLARGYVRRGHWTDESLGTLIAGCLDRDRALTARVWSEQRPFHGTLGDVDDLSRRLATGLRTYGIGPGDVVAFQLPNWVEAVAAFYAITMVGAVVAPVVHFYGPKELAFILAQSRTRLFITADRFGRHDFRADLDSIRPALPALETVVVVGGSRNGGDTIPFEQMIAGGRIDRLTQVDPDSPALVAYTSGTTADPKGVVHSHRSIVCEVRQLAQLQAERERPLLVGAPVGHGIGMLSALLVPRVQAHPLSLIDVWNPDRVLDAMAEADLSAGSGSTFFLTSLLDAPGCTPAHVARMSKIGLGGSPIPAEVARRADDLGINLVRSYGSTEHPSITGSKHSFPADKRLFTDGRTLPGVELRIVDPDDGRDLPAGTVGEIVSRGPDRFVGYTDPHLSDEAIDADGWYRTGDQGRLDDDGYLIVTDRLSDIIIRGGENISAAEVENLVAEIEGVAEVALVAAPDARLGEHGCVFIRAKDLAAAPSLEMISHHLDRAGLAPQKWPEELRVVDDFPRTPSGKIRKVTLRDSLRQGR